MIERQSRATTTPTPSRIALLTLFATIASMVQKYGESLELALYLSKQDLYHFVFGIPSEALDCAP